MLRKYYLALMLITSLSALACSNSSKPTDSGVIPCTTAVDCPAGQACIDGVCQQGNDGGNTCVFDGDCALGEVCDGGVCRPDDADGGTDGGDAAGDEAIVDASIQVDPAELDFGNARIGDTVTQNLIIRNAGPGDLTLFSLTLENGTSVEFEAEPLGTLNQVLPADDSLTVAIRYTPVDGSVDEGGLLIASNDPDQALIRVALSSSYKGTSEIAVIEDPNAAPTEIELIDFGAVPVATQSRVVLYVVNAGSGNAVLTVNEVRTQPISSDNFSLSLSATPPVYLNPLSEPCELDEDCGNGNTCAAGQCLDAQGQPLDALRVELIFEPGAVGQVQESLVVTNDEQAGAGDETVRIITLRGEGIQPALSVSPNPVDFGQLFVGNQATIQVNLSNGGGQALTVTSVAFQNGGGPFGLDAGGPGPWVLGPGQQLLLDASYTPAAEGVHLDALLIESDDPNSPMQVDLLGSASQPPVLALVPANLDFGEVQLGEVGQNAFSIHNQGGSPLSITSLTLLSGGSEFVLVQQAVPNIAPGASAQVDVTYAPLGAIGADSDLVRVTSNDPLQPEVLIGLSGIGTDPQLVLEPASIDFGPIYQGYTAGPMIINVRNVGFGQLRINDIRLAVGSSPDYNLQNLPVLPAELSNGQTLPVELYFTPTGSGLRTAALEVNSSDRDHLLESVSISGSGSNCPAGTWDANGDPGDGCEYLCDLSNGGVEDCDGIDNNCDAETDEGLSTRSCQQSNAFGTCTGSENCDGNNGWVGCDAPVPEQEICDGADNDCDAAIDAADNSLELSVCELQQGVCSGSIHRSAQCVAGSWQACTAIDYGGTYGAETCDGFDNDCDGDLDGQDASLALPLCELQQGVCAGASKAPAMCTNGTWSACGPAEYSAHDPDYSASETCDGTDNDCNGLTDASDAGMLLEDCELQQGLCSGATHRPALCVAGSFLPCDANDYGAGFGAEICDGADNDCDNAVDAGDNDLVLELCALQQGVCNGAAKTAAMCQAGSWGACTGTEYIAHDPAYSATESCDGADNDCNGLTDVSDPGLAIADCEDQDGVCAGAVHRVSLCQSGSWMPCEATDYETNNPDYSAAEICDGLDNNCDQQTDEGLNTRPCTTANIWGTCAGDETCAGGSGWTNCDAAVPAEETCNNIDDNCDGLTDANDGTLVLADCELQDGVCFGASHRSSLCVAGAWELCQSIDYTAHNGNFGNEVCGNAQDEDCSGTTDDKDLDADGFVDDACAGGSDCDDTRPLSYPGAGEVQDAADNDCDGLVDEGLIPSGAVVVTEIMMDPDGVLDAVGEYFEVTNLWSSPVNLHSWLISDNGGDAFNVVAPAGIVIGPSESAVFCINSDAGLNGGVNCDYDFDNFQLGNGSDEVILALDGFEIDRVEYLDFGGWVEPRGESLNLDPAAYDPADNDLAANWCATPIDVAYELTSGDHGTPGLFNPSCSGALALLDVTPDSGIEFGGETITLIGAGFTGATDARVGGVSCPAFAVIDDTHMSCLTPALAPGEHDVTAVRGASTATLATGYRTTGEDGAPGLAWCALQFPAATSTTVGAPTELIFGRVYKAGVTEPAGPPVGINSQVGYGPSGSDPRNTPGWLWFEASWNPSCPDCGNDDEFMKSLSVDQAGNYSMVTRFSEDGGITYTFCDYSPGTSDGFSAADLGVLIVNP